MGRCRLVPEGLPARWLPLLGAVRAFLNQPVKGPLRSACGLALRAR